MTRRERAILRLERRRTWAAGREADSTRRFNAAHNLVKDIPFGQPILVGHHSEGRHRRVLDRADSNMRRGVESAKMAEVHTSKAANIEAALDRTIFSDDANAIDALRERIAYRKAAADRVTELNKLIRKELKAGLTPGWMDRIKATDEEKRQMVRNVSDWRKSPLFPPYVNSNMRNLIRADEQRVKDIERQQARQARAEAAGGVLIETSADKEHAQVSFTEKPARAILDALKAAGFHWSGGSWFGYTAKLPESVRELADEARADAAQVEMSGVPLPAEPEEDSHGVLEILGEPAEESGD